MQLVTGNVRKTVITKQGNYLFLFDFQTFRKLVLRWHHDESWLAAKTRVNKHFVNAVLNRSNFSTWRRMDSTAYWRSRVWNREGICQICNAWRTLHNQSLFHRAHTLCCHQCVLRIQERFGNSVFRTQAAPSARACDLSER